MTEGSGYAQEGFAADPGIGKRELPASKRMTHMEKLACRICWLEFAIPRKDITERAYWKGVHPDKKREYVTDAEWLVWMVNKLNKHVSSQNLLWNTRRKERA